MNEAQSSDTRRLHLVENLGRDLIHAGRSLRRSPGLVVVSVLSLGIGIGVNTMLFSALRAILLYQPTVTDSARRVWVEPGNSNQFSFLNFRDLRSSGIFADVVGYRSASLALRSGDAVERVTGLGVTANFFQGLGIGAALGRTFTSEESEPERDPRMVVLDYSYWQRRFQGNPAVVGESLTLNGQPYLVLGVLPEHYRPLTALQVPDVYVPLSAAVLPTLQNRNNGNALTVLAHLEQGATREQAQSAVTALGAELERTYPKENEGAGRPAKVSPLNAGLSDAPEEFILLPILLLTLFGLVLLIACANVAGLLLTRAAGRRREIALRIALGASRGRLIQGLLAESFLLASGGAVAGLLLTIWLMPALNTLTISGLGDVHLNLEPGLSLYAYGLALIVITGTACGVIPALKATAGNLVTEIQQGGGHGATGRLRLRHAFVVGQVAASVTLLVIASLFLRSLMRITTMDPGFDIEHGAVARIDLGPDRQAREAAWRFAQEVLDRITKIPGVEAASVADIVPLGNESSATRLQTEAGTQTTGARTFLNSVGPEYFATMGITRLRGREFSTGDRSGTPPVVIVSRAFANAYFRGEDALGQRISDDNRRSFSEIVGVVGDITYQSYGEVPTPIVYFAYAQRPVSTQVRPLTTHVRTTGDPAAVLQAMRRAIASLDPAVVVDVSTLRTATNFEALARRVAATLVGSLGFLGLLLASIGLYGVMAYFVTSRTAEIGIRMALGASSRQMHWNVLGQGLKLVAYGIVLGTGLSLAISRFLTALLAGLSPADPVALGGTAAILIVVGLCASYFPARRAMHVNPVVALRAE
jgi:predicted permease